MSTPPWARGLRYHVPLVLGVAVCLFCGWFELTRARAGHTIAWVYVFEWPGFAVAGVAMWWRLLHDRQPRRPGPPTPRPEEPDDPGLVAWREYLEGLEQDGH